MAQAMESANLTIANADVAKTAYSAAYGLTTDTSYVAVNAAISELETAVNKSFKVRADIDTATAKLASATAVLNNETAVLITKMQAAIDSANTAFGKAVPAKAAYKVAYGLTTDAPYVAVKTAEAKLQVALDASFKVRADIDAATANLIDAITTLELATATLITEMQQAIESANVAIADADLSKTAYSAAYGLTTDASYVAVKTAISELETVVNASFKVRADIDAATANLVSAVSILKAETQVLITKMQQAIVSANIAIHEADLVKTAYLSAYGFTTDMSYVAVETAISELETVLNASFKVRADIDLATTNLVSAFTVLNEETAVLITEMQAALANANTAINSADIAKTAHIKAYGFTIDESYIAVETAIAELKTTVNASFKVKADIDEATANLVSAVTVLQNETAVLITEMQQAIESANVAIADAEAAKTAYTNAFGLTTDKTYKEVVSAIADLKTALNARFKTKTYIDLATENLLDTIPELNRKTAVLVAEMEVAIASANSAIADANLAKAAYSAAFGYTTDASYVAVETALAKLETAVNASFKVRTDIDTATAYLVSVIPALNDETAVLIIEMQQAIDSANLAVADADLAKAAYSAAYGLTTDASYIAVETARSELDKAVNAPFKVRADIETARANLVSAVTILKNETAILITEMQQAIDSANIAIDESDLAKAAYSAAYGLTTDASYVAVETAISELETAVNAPFKVRTAIDTATANLLSKVSVLNNETAVLIVEMQQAIESANLAVADADLAKAAYSAAYGLTTDASYVAVETAIAEVETAINATFKIRADIETAIANLESAVTALTDETAVLKIEMQQAIDSANLTTADANLAKVAYSAAYGLTTDASYATVETAITNLATAINAPFKVRADIETATANLSRAVSVLNEETAVLITQMEAAIASANTAFDNAVPAKAAFKVAYGLTTDAPYVAVETAEAELRVALDASFKVRADIDAATASLTAAIVTLEAATETMITEMAAAIATANTVIENADTAKTAHIKAYGYTIDASYVAVETAIAELETAVNATFKVKADIDSATANLVTAVTVLQNETAVLKADLQQAIESANAAIADAEAAKTAYTNAFGLTTDKTYAGVVSAISNLKTALNTTFKVTTYIELATDNLIEAIADLNEKTTVLAIEKQAIIEAANIAITNAAAAKTAYTVAGGLTTDAAYTTFEATVTALQTALNASPKVKVDIQSRTIALIQETPIFYKQALNLEIISATTLVNSAPVGTGAGQVPQEVVDAFTSAITDAQAVHDSSTAEGVDVEMAISDLNNAEEIFMQHVDTTPPTITSVTYSPYRITLTISEEIKTDININQNPSTIWMVTQVMESYTMSRYFYANWGEIAVSQQGENQIIIEVLQPARPEFANMNITPGTTYTLTIPGFKDMWGNPLIIKEFSVDADHEMQEAFVAASTAITHATIAKTAHTANGGSATDAAYVEVETTLGRLQAALNKYPRVKVDIINAIASLTQAVAVLEAETKNLVNAEMQAAVDAANTAITNANTTKTAYTDAGGIITDAAYVTAETAVAELQVALSASPKVKVDIKSKTDALNQAKTALEIQVSRMNLNREITNATSLLDAAVIGTEDGQYSQAAVDALNASIEEAQAVYDLLKATNIELIDTIAEINQAVKVFKQSVVSPYTFEIMPAAQLFINSIGISDMSVEITTGFNNYYSKRNIKDLVQVKRGNEVQTLSYDSTTNAFNVLNNKNEVTGELTLSSTTSLIQIGQGVFGLKLTPHADLTESTPAGLIYHLKIDGVEVATQTMDLVVDETPPEFTSGSYSEGQITLNASEKLWNGEVPNYTVEFSSDGTFEDTQYVSNTASAPVGNKMTIQVLESLNIQPASKFRIVPHWVRDYANNYMKQSFEFVVNPGLQQSIINANAAIANAGIAKGAFAVANGLTTDAAYVAVETKITSLTSALAAKPNVKANIDTATAELSNAVKALEAETKALNANLQQAISNANAVLSDAAVAKVAYTDANGLASEAVYVAVDTKRTALESALAATPKVKADIEAATVELSTAIVALETETALLANLQQAIGIANMLMIEAANAQAAYTAADGLTTDPIYVALETKLATLASVLAETPKSLADIEAATVELSTAIVTLEAETERLIAALQQAIDTANTVITEAGEAIKDYTASKGLTTDLAYIEVETKVNALESALAATPKVKTDIEVSAKKIKQAVNDLVKSVLTLEITHATILRDLAVAGTSTGTYLQESSDELTAAIAIAQKQVTKTDISIDEVRESTLVLVEAVSDFQKSSIVPIN
ncbi:hypothetical protein [Paenisporosarcina indica]|uniref:hypothetical protein n=1 Tax=Paenisporosarcina indica TaxID=650093 RepID=UPI001B80A389|nr:hypothetical protein [Paenisporosarcina indica]